MLTEIRSAQKHRPAVCRAEGLDLVDTSSAIRHRVWVGPWRMDLADSTRPEADQEMPSCCQRSGEACLHDGLQCPFLAADPWRSPPNNNR